MCCYISVVDVLVIAAQHQADFDRQCGDMFVIDVLVTGILVIDILFI